MSQEDASLESDQLVSWRQSGSCPILRLLSIDLLEVYDLSSREDAMNGHSFKEMMNSSKSKVSSEMKEYDDVFGDRVSTGEP